MTSKDYYETLEVAKNATLEEIKSAYRKQALSWHPDRHQGDKKKEAEERFKQINQAYEVLRDPEKRRTYDQVGHTAFTQNSAGGGAGNPFAGGFRQGPFTYTYSTNANTEDIFGNFSDPFDIFEQFFGGGGSSFGRRATRKPVYRLELTFMEAVQGVTKRVKINSNEHTVNIPAGVDDNTRIRFSEFDVVVSVQSDRLFKRQGQDVIVDIAIPFAIASLGGVISVPTVDGDIDLKVRPGTQPGTLVRLRERGIPYPRSNNRGDEYVRLTINVPKTLSRRQKDLLKEFEKS